jgi:hypothetical protein
MKVHSTVGLVTNSSSEVYWLPPEHDLDNVRSVMDSLWTVWCKENPEELKNGWFSGAPDDIPETISQNYTFIIFDEDSAAKRRAHWLSCGSHLLISRLISFIKTRGVEKAQELADEVDRVLPESKSNNEFTELSRLIRELCSADINSPMAAYDFDLDSYDQVLLCEASYWLKYCASHMKLTRLPFPMIENVYEDLRWAKACVPGAIEVNADYNAAPESFSEWVRDLWSAPGGQIG